MCTPIRAALWISECWDHLLFSNDAVVGGAMLGCEFSAIAGSFDDDLMGSVGQSVQSGIAQDRIVEQRQPLVHAAIGSDAKTRPAMALHDQLVQIVALLGVQ